MSFVQGALLVPMDFGEVDGPSWASFVSINLTEGSRMHTRLLPGGNDLDSAKIDGIHETARRTFTHTYARVRECCAHHHSRT